MRGKDWAGRGRGGGGVQDADDRDVQGQTHPTDQWKVDLYQIGKEIIL